MLIKRACKIEKGPVFRTRIRLPRSAARISGKLQNLNKDLNASDIESAVRMVAGTARSMGVVVAD